MHNKKYFIGTFSVLVLFFAVMLFYPLIKLGMLSFRTSSGFGFDNYRHILEQKMFIQAIGNSFSLSIIVGILATVIGFIFAYALNFVSLPKFYKRLLTILPSFPMFLPTIAYGFAMIYIFGRQGVLTQFFGREILQVYGFQGLLVGLLIYTVPISFTLLNNSMKYVDPKMFTVSKLMGDSAFKRFFTCLFRPLLVSLVISVIKGFFMAFTDFGLPSAIAGNYPLLPTLLFNEMLGATPNFARGTVVSIIMLLPTIATTVLMIVLNKYHVKSSNPTQNKVQSSLVTSIFYFIGTALLLFSALFLFVPIFLVPFVQAYPFNMTPVFTNFFDRLADEQFMRSFYNSIELSILTALVGTVVSFVAAYLSSRSPIAKQISGFMDFLNSVTNAIPGMVLGIAMLSVFTGTSLQSTLTILLVANVIYFFGTPYAMAVQALGKLSSNFETCGLLLGDRFIQTLFKVILPNMRHTVAEMASYLFINSMVTISALVFLVGVHTSTLTTKMRELQQFNRFNEVFTLALLLFATNLMAKLVFYILGEATFSFPKLFTKKQSIGEINS